MTTQEVANRFYELAAKSDWNTVVDELYGENVVSIEPDFAPMPRAEGLEAIRAKAQQFESMWEEVHGGFCNEPIVAGNFFSCAMGMDVTMKGMGRQKMEEIALYEVNNGKIVREQFFYSADGEQQQ